MHFFIPTKPEVSEPTAEFLEQFFSTVRSYPQPHREHSKLHYVPASLSEVKFVWLRDHAPRSSLSNRCLGPYEVVQRNAKTVTVELNGRNDKISIDRAKPAFLNSEIENEERTAGVPPAAASKQATVPVQKPPFSLQHGSVVLAKIKNYPVWPAEVVDSARTVLRTHLQQKNTTALRFFGTNNLAFVKIRDTGEYQPFNTSDIRLKAALALADQHLAQQQAKAIVTAPAMFHQTVRTCGRFGLEQLRRTTEPKAKPL